jgi:hypothetical protein
MDHEPRYLGERSRTAFGLAALGCLTLAFAVTPIRVRSQLASVVPVSVPVPELHAEATIASVAPQRDPFVPRVTEPPRRSALSALPDLPIGPLPPNAGAGPFPLGGAPRAGRPHPLAIALGAHPVAIVELLGRTQLVVPGDRLAGSTVSAIDADGLTLLDGTRLRFAAAGSTR